MLDFQKMIQRSRALAVQKTQVEGQGYFTDQEIIDNFLIPSWGMLYKFLVSQRENFFLREDRFTIGDDEQNEISVNSFSSSKKFYKVKKLDYIYSETNLIGIKLIDIRAENQLTNRYYRNDDIFLDDYSEKSRGFYVKNSDTIVILPKENSNGDYKLLWIPDRPPLIIKDADGNNIDNPDINIPEDFDQWIVFNAAVEMALSENQESQALQRQRSLWWKMITTWSDERDNSGPQKIHEAVDYDGQRTDASSLWKRDII